MVTGSSCRFSNVLSFKTASAAVSQFARKLVQYAKELYGLGAGQRKYACFRRLSLNADLDDASQADL
jgi:hypothetical protein